MIFLIRHTKPIAATGLCYGQTDVPLKEGWEERAKEIRGLLESQSVQRVTSSPLSRCHQLAEALSFGKEKVKIEPLIKELDFGEWEGKKWEEINQETLIHWGDHFVNVAPPGGEAFVDLFQRARTFWKELEKEEGTSVVVTHDGIIRSILAILMEIPLEKAFSLEIPYGSVIRLKPMGREQYRIRFLK